MCVRKCYGFLALSTQSAGARYSTKTSLQKTALRRGGGRGKMPAVQKGMPARKMPVVQKIARRGAVRGKPPLYVRSTAIIRRAGWKL